MLKLHKDQKGDILKKGLFVESQRSRSIVPPKSRHCLKNRHQLKQKRHKTHTVYGVQRFSLSCIELLTVPVNLIIILRLSSVGCTQEALFIVTHYSST